MCLVFEEPNGLLRGEDGAEFNMAVLLNDAEPLPGLKIERLTNFLGDNDLVFG